MPLLVVVEDRIVELLADEVGDDDVEPDVVDIASTSLIPDIATYISPFALSKTIPAGELSTFIVRTTVLLEPEITERELEPVFVTKMSPSVEA